MENMLIDDTSCYRENGDLTERMKNFIYCLYELKIRAYGWEVNSSTKKWKRREESKPCDIVDNCE